VAKSNARADIPAERLAELNAGRAEATNLTECLAVDFQALLRVVAPREKSVVDPALGIVQRMATVGALLVERQGELAGHGSDTVRGWSAFALAATPALDLAERVERMRPLADDAHFGVREWAWLALRPHLAAELPRALVLLAAWTREPSEYLRRFASEATRPRGVWCSHLNELKADPAPGLIVLEPLRSDPARYVQDSVSNWLNDAAKSQPEWVRTICDRWQRESKTAETKRICQRGLRTIAKAG
jgi:3-methyladenine DNA glycosylase AlkC